MQREVCGCSKKYHANEVAGTPLVASKVEQGLGIFPKSPPKISEIIIFFNYFFEIPNRGAVDKLRPSNSLFLKCLRSKLPNCHVEIAKCLRFKTPKISCKAVSDDLCSSYYKIFGCDYFR